MDAYQATLADLRTKEGQFRAEVKALEIQRYFRTWLERPSLVAWSRSCTFAAVAVTVCA